MTDFSKVSAGDSESKSPAFSAGWCNAVSEVAENFQSQKANGEAGGDGQSLKTSSGLLTVKNLAGSDLLRGNYVQLGDYLLTAVNHRRTILEGNLYATAESGRIAILTKAAKQNAFEPARTIGVCTARINITDTGHRFAAPADGSATLVSAASGDIEILSTNKISGTGIQELTVVVGGGGGSTESSFTARVITQIGPATGSRDDQRGTGTVKKFDKATGIVEGDAISVTHEWNETYAVDAKVTIKNGTEVDDGTCGTFPWTEEE